MRPRSFLLTLVSVAALTIVSVPTGYANDASMTKPPKDCYASYLNGYWEYQMVPGVKERWDGWTAETRGFCYYANGDALRCDTSMHTAPCCKYTEPRINPPSDHPRNALCWWGGSAAEEPGRLVHSFDLGTVRVLAGKVLGLDQVCQLIGTGLVKIWVQGVGTTVGLLVENCEVVDLVYQSPPEGCKPADPTSYNRYKMYADVRSKWDAYTASSGDVCSWRMNPRILDCKFWDGAIGATLATNVIAEVLCWYGEPALVQSVLPSELLDPDYIVIMSPGLMRAILNAEDGGEVAKTGIARGHIVVKAGSDIKQMLLKAALSGWVGDIGEGRGVDPSLVAYGDFHLQTVHGQTYVLNDLGAPIGVLPPNYNKYLAGLQNIGASSVRIQSYGADAESPGILLQPSNVILEATYSIPNGDDLLEILNLLGRGDPARSLLDPLLENADRSAPASLGTSGLGYWAGYGAGFLVSNALYQQGVSLDAPGGGEE